MRLSLALLTSAAAMLAACSPSSATTGAGGSTGTTGATICGDLTCPPGCSVSPSCTLCVPDTPDAGLGNSCTSDTDCCTGVCVRGICTLVSTSSSGSTTTTGTGGATGTSGTTSGDICTQPPAGNPCGGNTACGSGFFCAAHGDGGFCKAMCPACPCLGGLECNTGTGECEVSTTATSSSGATSGVIVTGTGPTAAATGGASTTTGAGTTGTTTFHVTASSTTDVGTGIVGAGTTGGTTRGTTSSSTTGGTTRGTSSTSGTIPIGDTCSSCNTDSNCSGNSDSCVQDPEDGNGYCAPSCATGTCANGYACSPETDNDGSSTTVCYPNSGTCVTTGGTTGGSSGGTTGGVIPVGDTCSGPCRTYFDCSGPDDWCVLDPDSTGRSGYCAPDCTSGTCSAGYMCTPETDSDGTDTDEVCYPNSGTCVSTGGSTGGTGGTTGGTGGSVGSSCTGDSDCTSQYCHHGVCACNCSQQGYCVTSADCCTAPGQGSSCFESGFSSGCFQGVCL